MRRRTARGVHEGYGGVMDRLEFGRLQAIAGVSGVVFSVNPVSGSRDEVMINATWGWEKA